MSLRRLELRLKQRCFNGKEKRLLQSFLCWDGKAPMNFTDSACRAWPELAKELDKSRICSQAGSARRQALIRIKRAFALSEAEWRMLCRIDPFYVQLVKHFPSRSYSEVRASIFQKKFIRKTLILTL